MKRLPAAALLLAVLLPAGVGAAEARGEIPHLLEFIGGSGCTFIRNGREHGSAEARQHIGNKYARVEDRVQSAEDFIEYTATRSSVTGKPYLVRCGEREMPAAEWLLDELGSFRSPGASGLPGEERRSP